MADEDIENRLRSIEAKLEENHRILVRMRRSQRTASWVRAGYWILVIILGFVSWYFIQPYIGQLGQTYGLTHNSSSTDQSSSTVDNLLDQLKSFQAGQQQQ